MCPGPSPGTQRNYQYLIRNMQEMNRALRGMKIELKQLQKFAKSLERMITLNERSVRGTFDAVLSLARIVQALNPDNEVLNEVVGVLASAGSWAAVGGQLAGPWGAVGGAVFGFFYSLIDAVID